MPAITFDTLEYVNHLKNANVPDDQAQAQARALRRVLDTALTNHAEELATRADLHNEAALIRKDLRNEVALIHKDMEMLRKDIIIKMGAMFVVAVGIIISVMLNLNG